MGVDLPFLIPSSFPQKQALLSYLDILLDSLGKYKYIYIVLNHHTL